MTVVKGSAIGFEMKELCRFCCAMEMSFKNSKHQFRWLQTLWVANLRILKKFCRTEYLWNVCLRSKTPPFILLIKWRKRTERRYKVHSTNAKLWCFEIHQIISWCVIQTTLWNYVCFLTYRYIGFVLFTIFDLNSFHQFNYLVL